MIDGEIGKLHSFSDFKAKLSAPKPPESPIGGELTPLGIPPTADILAQLEACGDPRAKAIIEDIKKDVQE